MKPDANVTDKHPQSFIWNFTQFFISHDKRWWNNEEIRYNLDVGRWWGCRCVWLLFVHLTTTGEKKKKMS